MQEGEDSEEQQLQQQLAAQQEACREARERAPRGSGGGWGGLWRWGRSSDHPGGETAEGVHGAGGCEAAAERVSTAEEGLEVSEGSADGGAAGRWQWLREITVKTVGAGASLLKQIGETHYQRLCVDKFHRDRVRFNKAKAALALQRGEIRRPHRSRGVSEHARQDLHREDLEEDAVCARAVELIYVENDQMVAGMESEFAAEVILPRDAARQGGEDDAGEWKADPKWAVVVLKRGLVRGGLDSEGVLVVFRGTHSWEDTMHDLLCIPAEHTSGVLLHRGVALAVSRTAPGILEALSHAMARLKNPRVIFTGHSYGGALALALQLHSLADAAWQPLSR